MEIHNRWKNINRHKIWNVPKEETSGSAKYKKSQKMKYHNFFNFTIDETSLKIMLQKCNKRWNITKDVMSQNLKRKK